MAKTKLGIEFEHVNMLKIQMFETCHMLLMLFCLNKNSCNVCSSSELLQLTFGEKKKKTLHGNENCSFPKTVIAVFKIANERYVPYLQLCGKT